MQENKMGVMPVGKLIISMSLPIMISMLVQALYNIVDSIFVARISENALTAVSMAFPIQNLMIAVGVGTAVGVNALLARYLGEKDFNKVNKVATNAVFLVALSYLLFLVIGLFLIEPFFRSQTDIEEIVQYGKQYLTVCSCVSMGIFAQLMFERMLQATGKTIYSMYTQLIGAIINLILDPILIFGLFGVPAMGITGAAAATVIGQLAAGVAAIWFNHVKNPEVEIKLKGFRPDKAVISQIYKIAVPSIIMQSIGSLTTFAMNNILLMFSSTAATVFGVYFKLQSFFFMPIFGLNSGLVPVLAYNYGARRKDRIQEALRFALILAVSVMSTGFVIFESIPTQLLGLFNASPEMLRIGVPALRIIAVNFPVAAVCIILGSTFQAFARSIYSLIVSLSRQLIVLIPAAWLLSRLGEVTYIWFAFPIAEAISLVISLLLYRKIRREIIDTL